MKSLYVTSVERYSGKTAVCLGLGKRFQADGYKVGYLKPLSLQPWMASGHIADEDAAFVKQILDLPAEPWELSPVVLTSEMLHERLMSSEQPDLLELVKAAGKQAATEQDILILEGGGSLREGYSVGLPTPAVAEAMDSQVLVVVKYRDDVRVLDDALAAQARLSKSLLGMLINRVPLEAARFVDQSIIPYLEQHGIAIMGSMPEVRTLAALSVEELVDILDAEVLAKGSRPEALVENLTVGAMTAEAALSRFRKQINKAVITGGDRTDIQLAALETSTTCLILTGNLRPSPLIVNQAKNFGVAVLLVPSNTMETVELIEGVYGKTRLGLPAKLARFEALMEEHVNFMRLYEALEIG
jgi:BioD-like phosphotransacetylase family protein